jgi:hypothetical protein
MVCDREGDQVGLPAVERVLPPRWFAVCIFELVRDVDPEAESGGEVMPYCESVWHSTHLRQRLAGVGSTAGDHMPVGHEVVLVAIYGDERRGV